MMRHTGGTEVGATSTRSYPCSCACLNASVVRRMPSCSLSGPMTRTSRTLISLLTRSLGTIRHLLLCQLMVLLCRLDVRTDEVERSFESHAAEVCSATSPDGQRPALHFSIADYKHKWYLCLLRFSNFEPNLFIPKVCLSADPRRFKFGYNLGNVWPLVVRNRHDFRLNRGEPSWEGAAEMFNQNAKEPLDRPHQSTMDHNRLMNFAVFPDVA